MFHIFDRVAMKTKAKENLKRNYWGAFLASLLVMLATGSVSLPSFGSSFNVNFNNSVDTSVPSGSPDVYGGGFAGDQAMTFFKIFGIVFAIIFFIAMVASIVRTIFVSNVFAVGGRRYYLNFSNGSETLGDIASGFSRDGKMCYWNVVKVMFRYSLYLALWSLLAFIPVLLMVISIVLLSTGQEFFGIMLLFASIGLIFASFIPYYVKYYEYSMIPYLLAEYPEMTAEEAFAGSKELTKGYKGELFVLDLSFLGWALLGSLAFGVGTYFVLPYMQATWAQAYITLCNINKQKQVLAGQPPVQPVQEPLRSTETQVGEE